VRRDDPARPAAKPESEAPKEEDRSYDLIANDAIRCRRCGMTSYNPNDISQRYCGRCHQFHEDS
jgi:ribosomal protein S27AE